MSEKSGLRESFQNQYGKRAQALLSLKTSLLLTCQSFDCFLTHLLPMKIILFLIETI